jgi:glycosyltransferase involved in cell wall biosynthesis
MVRPAQVVFIVNPSLEIGGVERKIADIAQYLSSNPEFQDRMVYLVLGRVRSLGNDTDIFFDVVNHSKIKILTKHQFKLGGDLIPFPVFLLWKIFTLHPATILAFSRRVVLFSLMLKHLFWWRKIRLVAGSDTLVSYAIRAYVPNRLERHLVTGLVALLYPRSDVVIVPSDTARRDLVQNFRVSEQRIVVNKNWVCATTCRKGDTPARFDLIYVGRFDRVKNLSLFVEIIALVRQTLPTVSACMVGGGMDMDTVKHLAQEYSLMSTISFVGFQRDVSHYLSMSKVFCLTSRYEGLPIAALEAMAHGLPVVTTGYPGADELVQDGKTGYVCANSAEYAAAITRLLGDENLRSRMGECAREFVRMHHGEKNLGKYVRLFMGQ